ncbi:PAS/PAC sensor signal transduction histidine kinase [Halosimplex carlsbadense 2-9-1]|uniref:histidine kinase n=1 Tax=Halosimplex carlsbadense 2-9-1 TaxID=797114 RepID=M0D0U4_9EURY|nr:histidine kinase N-terminal 7TM domain-containing protein [Halosimplex carlsbadense]ELZ29121.1 PAS/PAC sensor signal transduction histidine kinase [Halosimplex carlsbadense 2-9-1]
MALLPWPVAASFAAAAGTLLLVRYLRRYRGKPGADWFLASLGAQATWSAAYGAALLTFAEPVRWALEVVSWGAMAGTGVYFLAFALAYTGRGGVVDRARWGFAAFPILVGLIGATNPLHGLAWTDFTVVEALGVAGATYDMRLWALLAATAGVLLITVGSLLLFDTVVSYGPLYRREAVAVGLSTFPPVAAVLAWLYGVGPVPEVNFVTVAFLPHVALDAYAFVGSDMFEFHPATRRVGERAAIDDLGAPVVIVDEQRRVVTLNGAAETAFGVEKTAALTRPLSTLLGEGGDDPTEADTVTVQSGGRRRIFTVTTTPLSDAGGTHVGYTVVFQDVTEERRREQRLGVLNRVLRHNLRNDMTVVQGFTEAAAREVDDPEVRGMLDRAESKATELVALGEKARTVERVLDSDPRADRVDVAELLAAVRTERLDGTSDGAAADGGAATVTVEAADVTVTADPAVLQVVVGTLLENALEHAGEAPTVTLSAERRDDAVAITVTDDGPGVPDHELDVLTAGAESALEHGSGLGLWLADWGATALGGDLSFDTRDGTRATVTVPDAEKREPTGESQGGDSDQALA